MPSNRRLNLFQQLPPRIGRLEESITVQLRRVDLFMSEAFEAATRQEKLPRGVISSLAMIVANPGISQSEISRSTGIDKSGLVAIIDYLEDAGWIVRHKSREDRRRYALRATSAGEARMDKLVDAVRGFESAMLASLSERDLTSIQKLLDRMLRSCREQGAPIVPLPEQVEQDDDPEPLRKTG